MITRQIDEVIYKVRTLMDELGYNDADFVNTDIDNLNINNIIKSKILEAIRQVYLSSPYKYLSGEYLSVVIESDGDKKYFNLPKDYLKVVSVKCSSWLKPVTDIIYEDDPLYILQSDIYTRGSSEFPVAAITKGEDSDRVELYTIKAEDIVSCCCILLPQFEKDGEITTIQYIEKLEPSIISQIAGMVTSILKDEIAQVHFENAKVNLL